MFKCKHEEQGYCMLSNNLSVKCYKDCPIEERVKLCDICHERIATRNEKLPVDADIGDEGEAVAIWATIPICEQCLEDYENQEGYWERRD